MTKAEFWGYAKMMQAEYRKEYPKNLLASAFAKVEHVPAVVLSSALDSVMLRHNNLPSLQTIIDATLSEYGKRQREAIAAREADAKEEKKKYDKGTRKAFHSGGIAKDSMTVILGLLSGKISRGEFMEGVGHLNNKYPSAGFDVTGGKMKNLYADKGLDLQQAPQNISHENSDKPIT